MVTHQARASGVISRALVAAGGVITRKFPFRAPPAVLPNLTLFACAVTLRFKAVLQLAHRQRSRLTIQTQRCPRCVWTLVERAHEADPIMQNKGKVCIITCILLLWVLTLIFLSATRVVKTGDVERTKTMVTSVNSYSEKMDRNTPR